MNFDLHTHSTASDGTLEPHALWQLAQQQALDLFALTDHDTIAGYNQLQQQLSQHKHECAQPRLISGVEISSTYYKQDVHIVGLDFDQHNPAFLALLKELQQLRQTRGEAIAQRLEKILKIDSVYTRVLAHSHCHPWQLGRPHFARWLVAHGLVRSIDQAFKRWLGRGKPAFTACQWPDYTRVIQVLNSAGGVSVLAHPLKYKLTKTRLRAMIAAFAKAEGRAIELVNHQQSAEQTHYLLAQAQRFGLYASGGSDFHSPELPWAKVGQVPALPTASVPIWQAFN